MNRPPEWPASWLYYVQVDGIDDKVEAVRSTGGTILNGPMDVPGGGRIAQGLDPQGGAFAIYDPEGSD